MRRGGAILPATILFLFLLGLQAPVTAVPVQCGYGGVVCWSSTNANAAGTNYVAQDLLNSSNADAMRLLWTFSFPSANPPAGLNVTGEGAIAPSLIVLGVAYVVTNDLHVYAIDTRTGGALWTYRPVLVRTGLPLGTLAGHVHGLTSYLGLIWLSLPDCSAVGLDPNAGSVVFHITRICAGVPGNAGKYDYSGASLSFYRDLLIWTASSVSEGTDAGRGFVAAYNLTDHGSLAWRWFVSPPAGGDPNWDATSCPLPCHGNVQPVAGDWGDMGLAGGETRAGAGPGWGQPAVDAADGIVFLGTSQPSPDWNATYRPGPNLYSDSVIALNASSGRMLWFYQTTPHDLYDFDCGWNVALGGVDYGGVNRIAVFKACKNGFVYALDARSGALLWHFDPPNLARMNTGNADYMKTGLYNATMRWVSSPGGAYEQCPGIHGGVESDISVAYGKVFVATHNFCSFVTVGSVSAVGGSVSGAAGIQYDMLHANTTIYALDAATGAVDWSFFVPQVPYRGWLTSSGGLVFASTLDGRILSLDQATGSLVGTTNVGGALYTGITLGSQLGGGVIVLQSTSAPAYGAFVSSVPGSLLAFGPGPGVPSGPDLLPWVFVALAAAGATLLFARVFLFGRKATQREAASGESRAT